MTAHSDNVTIVLVHGAWADASSWRRVIKRLQSQGLVVIAVQNPTSSLVDDVAATRLILDGINGPVVLAGHSWGGTVITQAGNDPKETALVYVAAYSPPPGLSGIEDDGAGHLKMSVASWITNVAQDLPESDARVMAATQPPLGAATFDDKVTQVAWADRPCWYVLSVDDRAVSPDLQRDLAIRLNAKTTELKTSHLSLLSDPDSVANVIIQAAAA